MMVSPLFPGERLPRLHVSRERITVQGGNGVYTERVTIMNEGGGVLKGTARTDVDWIRLPNPNIETSFINPFRLEIDPRKLQTDLSKGTVTIITNGGTAKITAEYVAHPEPKPVLSLDNKELRFCNLRRGDDLSAHLMIRNKGTGVLSGTIDSESGWIEVKTRTVWVHTLQAVQIVIHTASAPPVSQPVGRITIRTSGGSMEVLVSLHFRTGAAPKLRLDPPRIRSVYQIRGIIEEQLTIHNEGEGVLRGTIPSPVPWIKLLPSIFPVEKSTRIRIAIDTRNLPDGTISVQIPVITNAGRDTLTVDVVPGIRHQAVAPSRRTRSTSRIEARRRMTAYDQAGRMYTLISAGKAGGEGEIFLPAGIGTQCAKIFHPHRRTPDTDEKLRIMVKNPLPPSLAGRVTWPEILLYDRPGGGRVIGYLMRRIPEESFKPAHLWYDEPQGIMNGIPPVTVALTLSHIIEGIHRCGHSVGDLRENNLLISKAGDIVLIDTDSFQIRDPVSGKVFWSRVGTAEYLPPEHLDGSFAHDGCDRRCGDHFALAVLIFRFLMNGVHPFQAKGPLVREAPATSDKILLGYFAYETRLCGIGPPDYAPPYERVPLQIRCLFREAFIAGHKSPQNRPDAGKWTKVLGTLVAVPARKEMKRPVSSSLHEKRSESRPGVLTDLSGKEITPGRLLYRLGKGVLYETAENEVLLSLLPAPVPISAVLSPRKVPGIPPSVITPIGPVIRGEGSCVGWLLKIDSRERYLPWHLITDPESRIASDREGFSFRHRLACCRNLISALISAINLDLPRPILSLRSVYVGPDASVRVFSFPTAGRSAVSDDSSENPAVLVYQMLMDGYSPDYGAGMVRRRAPSPAIIPPEIKNLFQEEFGTNGKEKGVSVFENLHRWYGILDKTLKDLVQCARDPDHWYVSGVPGCPWCTGKLSLSLAFRVVPLLLPAPPTVAKLPFPRISGLLGVPARKPVPIIICADTSSRWGVIPLPAEQCSRIFLPVSSPPVLLPLLNVCTLLPVPWRRSWIVCMPSGKSACPEMEQIIPPLRRTDESGKGDHYSSCPALSLIDEMILASTMDRLKGEGVRRRKRRLNPVQNPRTRKIPIEIMLYPIYLPGVDETKSEPVDECALRSEKSVKKRRSDRPLHKKIQKLILDFIG
jgi:serine/threonine protein kinase